ncbi:MAG: hypothetical protein SH856_06885 [Flavobacteriales bacterium]|nr:hypothetical protein [Flavobacteriales bacterium]
MHSIEPYYNWRGFYVSSEDPLSPFFEREYSEFEFSEKLYNYFIHPQWDSFGSQTLFIKILFTDYEERFAIVELLGEWNDLLYNDIMLLKREIIEPMMQNGINKFVLIGENILNFHASDDCYYEEWFDEVSDDEDGWIALMNLSEHVIHDFQKANIDSYFVLGGKLNEMNWRTHHPFQLFQLVESQVMKRLGAA